MDTRRNGLFRLAEVIGGLGCLAASIWLYVHGYQNGWIIALGVIGALEAI